MTGAESTSIPDLAQSVKVRLGVADTRGAHGEDHGLGPTDYRINAQVRALLVRRGIDLAKLEHGVTNGVVYLKGIIRSYLSPESDDLSEAKLQEASIAHRLERAIKQIRQPVTKCGRRWQPI